MPIYSRHVSWSVCTVLLLLACMIAGCSSSQAPATSGAPQSTPGGGNTITIKNFAFDPPVLTVKPGTVVTWMNQDGTAHTVVSDTGSPAAFSSAPLSPGASFAFTVTQPGTYGYSCSIHPSMKGTLVVQS